MSKILLIEDDPAIARLVINFLTTAGFACLHAPDGISGMQSFSDFDPHLVPARGPGRQRHVPLPRFEAIRGRDIWPHALGAVRAARTSATATIAASR